MDHQTQTMLVHDLFELGINVADIHTLTSIPLEHVRMFVKLIGWKTAFPKRPTPKHVYPAVLLRYAKLKQEDAPTDDVATMRLGALAKWLREGEMLSAARALDHAVERLLQPAYDPQPSQANLPRLIAAIFNECVNIDLMADTLYTETGEELWELLLTRIANGDLPAPTSYVQTSKRLAELRLQPMRVYIMPIWDQEVFRQVEAMINDTLDARRAHIIRERFGIGMECKTLHVIANEFHLSQGRVRDLEKQAINRLRHEAQKRGLDAIVRPVGNALQRELETRKERTAYGVQSTPLHSDLRKPITELELSVRIDNVLRNSWIEYIGDLVTMSEAELLKKKNFGRKGLKEVKEVLAELGIALGMDSESLAIRAFQAWKTEQTERTP